MADIKDKIRKLLALASNNPSEGEAQAALLRARELMAKHKLSEMDCVEALPEVVTRLTNWRASKRSAPWMITLASVIAQHYCCEPYINGQYRKQTYTIGFAGFQDDADICVEVFNYAAQLVTNRIDEIRQQYKLMGISADAIRRERNNYGIGFAQGMENAYARQERETNARGEASGDTESNRESWGLVMAVPKEVSDFLDSIVRGSNTWNATYNERSSSYTSGYAAGQSFADAKALKEASA